MNTSNPLQAYFRQPAIYVKLPSQGKFYPPGALEPTQTGELPVLPMTAIDEITYRTPDALFNGQAVVNVIQSCLPNIKDAWTIPSIDMDTILVSIRLATYGHEMEFSTQCPSCNEVSDQLLDLRSVLDRMVAPDYSQTISHGDLIMYFKPMTYKNMNDNNKLQFEQQKMLDLLPSEGDDVDERRLRSLSDSLVRITELTIKALSQNVASIQTPTAMVKEPEYIEDFLRNCDKTFFKKVEEFVISMKSSSEIQPLPLKCPHCEHEYKQTLTLDMATFFGAAS